MESDMIAMFADLMCKPNSDFGPQAPQTEIELARKETEVLSAKCDALESKLGKVQKSILPVSIENASLKMEVERLQQTIDFEVEDKREMYNRIKELQKQIRLARIDKKGLQSEVDEKDKQIQNLEDVTENLKEEASKNFKSKEKSVMKALELQETLKGVAKTKKMLEEKIQNLEKAFKTKDADCESKLKKASDSRIATKKSLEAKILNLQLTLDSESQARKKAQEDAQKSEQKMESQEKEYVKEIRENRKAEAAIKKRLERKIAEREMALASESNARKASDEEILKLGKLLNSEIAAKKHFEKKAQVLENSLRISQMLLKQNQKPAQKIVQQAPPIMNQTQWLAEFEKNHPKEE